MSINCVMLTGNLTRSAELRTTQGGTNILNFGIAVNERRKNQQTGEWEDIPNFFDLSMFGNRAEKIAPYLTKGTKVTVQGRLHYSSWQAQDGSKRSKVDVIVDEIEFMSRGQQQAPRQAPPMQQAPGGQVYVNQAPMGYQQQQPEYSLQEFYGDEDIPF